jgi:hypothetical protein
MDQETTTSNDQLFRDFDPKRGDTLIFPDGPNVKIDSVSDGMVWWIDPNSREAYPTRCTQISDLVSSGKPNTWVYRGDTQTKVNPARAGK